MPKAVAEFYAEGGAHTTCVARHLITSCYLITCRALEVIKSPAVFPSRSLAPPSRTHPGSPTRERGTKGLETTDGTDNTDNGAGLSIIFLTPAWIRDIGVIRGRFVCLE